MNAVDNWKGHTTRSTAYLDPDQANRMAVMLDRKPNFRRGDVLPPAWHWLYFHDLVEGSRLGRDGHPQLGIVMPPVPLTRRMWAGGSMLFSHLPHLGDTATRTSTISDIVPKEGRSGPLFFVTVDHRIDVDGLEGIQEQQTIVYREREATGKQPVAAQARTDAAETKRWAFDSTALFRYSALTYNSHKIHYDADYARDVEGYPGLVIHGPLLATLLLDQATEAGGSLASFSYRAKSPLCLPEVVTINHRLEQGGAALWAASEDNRLAMDANATYKEMDQQ